MNEEKIITNEQTNAEIGGGDPNTSTSEKAEQTVKTFTQEEVDNIIKQRLERAKKDMPDKARLDAFKAWEESQKTTEQKQNELVVEAQKAQNVAEQRAADYEAKYLAMTKGVSKEAVDDVIALAKSKADESTTLEKAIDMVIAKYPQFSGGQSMPKITAPVSSNNTGGMSGVEAAFMAKNPNLKI